MAISLQTAQFFNGQIRAAEKNIGKQKKIASDAVDLRKKQEQFIGKFSLL